MADARRLFSASRGGGLSEMMIRGQTRPARPLLLHPQHSLIVGIPLYEPGFDTEGRLIGLDSLSACNGISLTDIPISPAETILSDVKCKQFQRLFEPSKRDPVVRAESETHPNNYGGDNSNT